MDEQTNVHNDIGGNHKISNEISKFSLIAFKMVLKHAPYSKDFIDMIRFSIGQ